MNTIHTTHKEDMVMVKFTRFLLWKLESLELSTIKELKSGVNGFVFWFSLEGNRLAGDEVDLKRV
jgi:hypothetical protein